MIQSPPRTILEVFESLPEGTLCQVINNQLVMWPAPSSKHQQAVRDIAFALNAFVTSNALGEVLFAPIDIYLNEENIFEPDIVFISNERLHILQDKIKGAPDLIVEVLSPATENYDKRMKKTVYEQSGVKEYWLIDPKTKQVTGYALSNDRFIEITSEAGVIASPLLGTTVQF